MATTAIRNDGCGGYSKTTVVAMTAAAGIVAVVLVVTVTTTALNAVAEADGAGKHWRQ